MNEPTTGQIFDALLAFQDAVSMYFTKQDRRFDAIDKRLDGIDGRLDGMDGRLDRLERKVTMLEIRMDEGFTAVNERLGNLEARRRR